MANFGVSFGLSQILSLLIPHVRSCYYVHCMARPQAAASFERSSAFFAQSLSLQPCDPLGRRLMPDGSLGTAGADVVALFLAGVGGGSGGGSSPNSNVKSSVTLRTADVASEAAGDDRGSKPVLLDEPCFVDFVRWPSHSPPAPSSLGDSGGGQPETGHQQRQRRQHSLRSGSGTDLNGAAFLPPDYGSSLPVLPGAVFLGLGVSEPFSPRAAAALGHVGAAAYKAYPRARRAPPIVGVASSSSSAATAGATAAAAASVGGRPKSASAAARRAVGALRGAAWALGAGAAAKAESKDEGGRRRFEGARTKRTPDSDGNRGSGLYSQKDQKEEGGKAKLPVVGVGMGGGGGGGPGKRGAPSVVHVVHAVPPDLVSVARAACGGGHERAVAVASLALTCVSCSGAWRDMAGRCLA